MSSTDKEPPKTTVKSWYLPNTSTDALTPGWLGDWSRCRVGSEYVEMLKRSCSEILQGAGARQTGDPQSSLILVSRNRVGLGASLGNRRKQIKRTLQERD